MQQGIRLLLVDVQKDHVHFSDNIFLRDRLPFVPVSEADAVLISVENSRDFLSAIGIQGEIIYTPSHSKDSISLMLDDGSCLAGDLEPFEYMEAYEENAVLERDWEHILSFHPKTVFFAHRPEKVIDWSNKS